MIDKFQYAFTLTQHHKEIKNYAEWVKQTLNHLLICITGMV